MKVEAPAAPGAVRTRRIAIVGTPNSGKTTVFNALTGLRQRVGNYAGVTVEKKEGSVSSSNGGRFTLIDLPGLYSLTPGSPDERITADILVRRSEHEAPPDGVLCILDSTNLERNLSLVGDILEHGYPTVLALNMTDVAADRGITIDVPRLASRLGIPVVTTVAHRASGLDDLRTLLTGPLRAPAEFSYALPGPLERERETLADRMIRGFGYTQARARYEAAVLLGGASEGDATVHPSLIALAEGSREKLLFLGIDPARALFDARRAWSHLIATECVRGGTSSRSVSLSDRLDRVLTHRVWGPLVFALLMAMMFQAIFTWAALPMQWIASAFDELGLLVTSLLPPGDFRALVVDGAIAGVSAVVSFLPQVLLMFLFIGLLEETGYMARAAFIMNRVMGRFGLHGKSFIPLLSSFACAIPGIMATRTIESPRDRLATMLVAPLMSCSARLPVFTLMIAAFVPDIRVLGVLSLPGLTLLGLYLLGITAALAAAWALKRTLLKGSASAFIMELPPYALPAPANILHQMWNRAWSFLQKAGTIILGASILLWFLATYPKLDEGTASERLSHSAVGRIGKAIEPAVAPLGFDWKIGIGLVASVFQREMFVSTMGTLYNIDDSGGDQGSVFLRDRLRQPSSGFTPLTAVCVMIYYVLAMQCLSTVAVMRRETGGWRWPLFQIAYMTGLAYGVTWIVRISGMALGMG